MPEVEHARDRDPPAAASTALASTTTLACRTAPSSPFGPQRDVHPGAEHEHRKPQVAEKRDRRIL